MPTLPPRPRIAPGPSRHVYDVIVVGPQLGGALAAALLAKRGHRVLWAEHGHLTVGYEHAGFHLPLGPFVLPGLRTMPSVEEAFTELGLTTTVQRMLKAHAPPMQLVLPRHRLDLSADETRRRAECKREFGASGAQIAERLQALGAAQERTDPFFRHPEVLASASLLGKWRLSREVARLPGLREPFPLSAAEPAEHLLSGLARFLLAQEDPGALGRTRSLSQVLKATQRFPGGWTGLRELIAKRFLEVGGTLLAQEGLTGAVVEAFTFEGGKLVGFQMGGAEATYRAQWFVGAGEAEGLADRLPEAGRRARRARQELRALPARHFLLAVNWVLPAAALPRGLGDLALLDAPAELGPVLVQVLPARKDSTKAEDDGARVITAGAVVPVHARTPPEALRALVARLEAVLGELLPFAAGRRLARSVPVLDAPGAREALPGVVYARDEHGVLGIGGLPLQTPLPNLLLASREVFPGLGLEGELLAGMLAARRIREVLRKRDPLRR